MYDKTVRRRRAVLACSSRCSLILLTAYFGESAGGGLHSVQRGALEVARADPGGREPRAQAGPRPVRLVRRHARRQGASATSSRSERDALRAARSPSCRPPAPRTSELRALLDIDTAGGLDGLRAGDRARHRALAEHLVLDGRDQQGLERRRARRPARGQRRGPRRQGHDRLRRQRGRDADHRPRSSASPPARRASGEPGIARARRSARPATCCSSSSRAASRSREGDRIVTAGTVSTRLQSLFPPGIPIGTVTRSTSGEGELDRRIHVRPAADLRRLDFVQVLTEPAPTLVASTATRRRDLDRAASSLRLVAARPARRDPADRPRSRRSRVFGVPADLSPLLVASVGLLCGSVPGALFGFGVGLFVDIALLQTLGVTSLVLLAVGYGAGRLRELRDPAHGARRRSPSARPPPRSTRSASRSCSSCSASTRPVSLLLVRQILLDDRAQHAARAARLRARAPRRCCPFLPDDPRRRRRRAYTTGGLSARSRRAMMPPDLEERRPADHAAARAARRRARRLRLRAVRDHLLPPVVPAGALRRRVLTPGAREPRAQDQASRRRAATSSTATARRSSRPASRRSCRSCRAAARGRARGRRQLPRARSSAERARLAAAEQLRALERTRRERGAPLTRAERRERRAPARARAKRRAVAVPPMPPPSRAARALPPARQGARHAAAHDPPARRSSRLAEPPYANVTVKTDVAARRLQLPQERQDAVPRRRRREAVPARLPVQRRSAPSCSARCARSSPTSSSRSATAASQQGTRDRQGRHRGDLRPLPARQRRLHARASSTRSATATTRAPHARAEPEPGPAAAA